MSEPAFQVDERVTFLAAQYGDPPHLSLGPYVVIAAVIVDGDQVRYMVRHDDMQSMGWLWGPYPASKLRRGWPKMVGGRPKG